MFVGIDVEKFLRLVDVMQYQVSIPGVDGDIGDGVMLTARELEQRPAVQRGRRVNKVWGPEEEQLPERHSAADLD